MRRNWKRILSLLLTVAMVFTMNTSVFASVTGVTYDAENKQLTFTTDEKETKNTDEIDHYLRLSDDGVTKIEVKVEDKQEGDEPVYKTTEVDKTYTKADTDELSDEEKTAVKNAGITLPESDPKTTIYKLVKGEETTYYLADGSAVTYNDETKAQYEVSETTADALEGVRSLKFYKNGEDKVFYKVENEKNVKVEDATDLEKALAEETDVVTFSAKQEDANEGVNGDALHPADEIGWEIVNWKGEKASYTGLTFGYVDGSAPYTLRISQNVISGNYLHPTADAKAVKIEMIDAANAKDAISIMADKPGVAVKVNTVNGTKIALSSNNTRLITVNSSGEWTDETTDDIINKGSGVDFGTKAKDIDSDDYYIVLPNSSETIGKISENGVLKGESYDNSIIFEKMDAIFMPNGYTNGTEYTVVPANGKADKTNVARVHSPALGGAGEPVAYPVFAVKKDGEKVNVYSQKVAMLSDNNINTADLGNNEIQLGISMNKILSDSLTISVNTAESDEGKYGQSPLEVALISGNYSDYTTGRWIHRPDPNKVAPNTAKQEFTVTGLEGNKEYWPAVRAVSAASVADGVIYLPSAWVTTTLASGGVKTKPEAGKITFATTVSKIGRTTASVNVLATDTTGEFKLAGIYVADSTEAAPEVSTNNANKWFLAGATQDDARALNNIKSPGNYVEADNATTPANWTFALSGNNGLEPGKLYNIYAMGYLTGGALKADELVYSAKPIATFGTVQDYSLGYKLSSTYTNANGENVKIDGNTITLGAQYQGGGAFADNALENLEVSSFSLTMASSNGLITVGPDEFDSIDQKGKDQNGITRDILKQYLAFTTVSGGDLTTYQAYKDALNAANNEQITKNITKEGKTTTIKKLASLADQKAVSAPDAGKTYDLKISFNELIKYDGSASGLYGENVTAKSYNLSVVGSNLYVYPAFAYQTGSSISNGQISGDGIRYSYGWAADTKEPADTINRQNWRITEANRSELASFKLTNAKGTEVVKLGASTKFPIAVTAGEYKLALTDIKNLKVPDGVTEAGYVLQRAKENDYTTATKANFTDKNVKSEDSSITAPFSSIIVDLKGDETIEFSLTKNTNWPIYYGTLSANDKEEEYMRKAFTTKINVKGDANNDYSKKGIEETYIKFTTVENEGKNIQAQVSGNRLSAFNSMAHEVDLGSVQAGTKVYAVMLVKVGTLTGTKTGTTLYDRYGYQVAVAPVTVEARKVTLSWNGALLTNLKANGGPVIKEIGRGDTAKLKEDISINSANYKYISFFAQDASGNAIVENAKNKAVGTTGIKLASTGEVVSKSIFTPYVNTATLTGGIAADKTVKSTDTLVVNKSNVTIGKSGSYPVTLTKLPTLSTNDVTVGSGSSATKYSAFGKNFNIGAQNIKVDVTKRTTIKFKASFTVTDSTTGKSETRTLDTKQFIVTVANNTTTFKDAAATNTEAKRIADTFVKSALTTDATHPINNTYSQTASACVIPNGMVGNALGFGEITGFTVTNGKKYEIAALDSTTGTVDGVAGQPTYITENQDYVIEANITVHVTDGRIEYTVNNGEQNITIATMGSVVYDGRSHVVIDDYSMKANMTTKVNDLQLSLENSNKIVNAQPYKLVYNKDYKVTYKNNKDANVTKDEAGSYVAIANAKQPNMTITGIGDYKGLNLKINFNIVADNVGADAEMSTGTASTEGTEETKFAPGTTTGYDYEAVVTPSKTYIRSTNDAKGNSISVKVQETREFTQKADGTEKQKTVTLGAKDVDNYIVAFEGDTNTVIGRYPIKEAKNVLKAPTNGADFAKYAIVAVGKGNYTGEKQSGSIYVFPKNSAKLLDNATVNWSKDMSSKSFKQYSTGKTITMIAPSVKMKNGTVYTAKNGDVNNKYKLELQRQDPTTKAWYVYDADFNPAEGEKLLPGSYKAKVVGDQINTYGESKTKSFTIAAENLPSKSEVKFKATENGKAISFDYKTSKLPYTGFDTDIEVTAVGSLKPTEYLCATSYTPNTKLGSAPGEYKITITGQKQYTGKKIEFKVKRQQATMSKFIKDEGMNLYVQTLSQNINGAMPAENELYLTMFNNKDEIISKGVEDAAGAGHEFVYEPDYTKNEATLIFTHTISQAAAHKGATYTAKMKIKFDKNKKVTEANKLAKATATGDKKVGFITGSGLTSEYSINVKNIVGNEVTRYNAVDVANGALVVKPGQFYYTVEDIKANAKNTGYKPKFVLYQATGDLRAGKAQVTNKTVPASEYNVPAEWSLSSNGYQLTATMTTNAKAKSYVVEKDKAVKSIAFDFSDANGYKDGAYVYANAAKVDVKKGLTLNEKKTDKANLNDTIRFLDRDAKSSSLVYTYNGLYTAIAESIQKLDLTANKSTLTLDGTATTSSSTTVALKDGTKTNVSKAIEIISITPSSRPLNEGKYTVKVRIRPDVAKGSGKDDPRYGGTFTFSFNIKKMAVTGL